MPKPGNSYRKLLIVGVLSEKKCENEQHRVPLWQVRRNVKKTTPKTIPARQPKKGPGRLATRSSSRPSITRAPNTVEKPRRKNTGATKATTLIQPSATFDVNESPDQSA